MMHINVLTDRLPHHVTVGGVSYAIQHDFRTSIRFEVLIRESELPNEQKLRQALKLYYGDCVPKDVDTAMERLLWFYSGGTYERDATTKEPNAKEEPTSYPTARVYSYTNDANYILSAFYQQYGIDLTKSDMHWWKFKALFQSLTDTCLFSKVMYYRSVKVTSKMPKAEQQRLRELKQLYALPLTDSERKRVDEIEKALSGDGDLSRLL